ncbi:hypothetical protein D9M68_746330 [compost metagenome]
MLQLVDQAGDFQCTVDNAAHAHQQSAVQVQMRHLMIEGQRDAGQIGAGDRVEQHDGTQRLSDAVGAQDHAFGHAGGAGGVHDIQGVRGAAPAIGSRGQVLGQQGGQTV